MMHGIAALSFPGIQAFPGAPALPVALAFLVSGVLFVLALRDFSRPRGGRRGHWFVLAGMAIAALTTIATHKVMAMTEIFSAIVIGGGTGFLLARHIATTAMPQLIAAFHSLVGLAVLAVGAAAFLSPLAFGIADPSTGLIYDARRMEMALAIAFGAVAASGSVTAFLKLNGILSRKRYLAYGLAVLAAVAGAAGYFTAGQTPWALWALALSGFGVGCLLMLSIRSERLSMALSALSSCSGWAVAATGFLLQNMVMILAGGLVGAAGATLSFRMRLPVDKRTGGDQ